METEIATYETQDKSKCQLSATKWILIVIVAVIITGLATNMDRIVSANEDETSCSSSLSTFENECDLVIIGAGVTDLLHSYL